MNLYTPYTANPLFFKWIFNSSPELHAYWDHYLKMNPDEREPILKFKAEIETYLRFEDKVLSEKEKKLLALRIAHKLDKLDSKSVRRRKLQLAMRYAAIALIFFVTGGGLMYLYLKPKQQQIALENHVLPVQVQDPVLILGDNSQITLNQGESQLEYSSGGKIILNQEQTIKEEIQNAPPEINTLVIPYGSRTSISLSDGTKVWLNAGSRLIYPSRFVDKIREVYLVGEAFFEVQENEKQPFLVKTSEMNVEVYGTRFNVMAYPEDNTVQTVLAEGSVVIKTAGAVKTDKGIKLEPGYMAYYDKKTQETKTKQVNVDEYTLWTKGLLKFTNTDFNRITQKLERYYNIQFRFEDPFKGMIKISGKLDVTTGRTEVFLYLERLTGLKITETHEGHYVIK